MDEITAGELEAQYGTWGRHPAPYGPEDWQKEVAEGDTRRGYWEWVAWTSRIDAEAINEEEARKSDPVPVPIRVDALKPGDVLAKGTVLRVERNSLRPTDNSESLYTVFTEAGQPGSGDVRQAQYFGSEILTVTLREHQRG
jgi:hypothetical protein